MKQPSSKRIKMYKLLWWQRNHDPTWPRLKCDGKCQKYFDRYGKLKRTYEALSTLTKETFAELSHLESVSNALEIARDENDLAMIKEELIECGYMKRHGRNQKRQGKSKPLHYISSDGFHMYVGKTTSRTTNYLLNSLTEKICGFMLRKWRVLTSS